jgi:hypothetical protein
MTTFTAARSRRSGEAFEQIGGELLQSATQAAGASARVYLDGLDSAVDLQRRLIAGTPLAPLSGLLTAQASVTRQVLETYVELLGHTPSTTVRAAADADQTTAQLTGGTGEAAAKATRRTRRAVTRAAKSVRATAAKPAAAPQQAPAAQPEPPIANYDALTADELVAKLPEVPQRTLAAVAAYERAHQSRSTVLERVSALQGSEPTPGYDELAVDEVTKLLADGTPELAGRVVDYERRHKGRATVLEAAERHREAS